MTGASRRPTANIYVDGFNLYRQKLTHHPHTKWLDLESMSQKLLADHEIRRIRYFTALIRPIAGSDPRSPQRQQSYIRALEANPKLTVHYGQFRSDKRLMPVLPIEFAADGSLVRRKVRKTEEKGSDVSLASYMLLDAFRDEADLYVLVSNDSDFAGTLTIMTSELSKDVGIFSPVESLSQGLAACGIQVIRKIRAGVLEDSQMPDVVRVGSSLVHRPDQWRKPGP